TLRPFTVTRPSAIQRRASVREPSPARESARSSVFNLPCGFASLYHRTHAVSLPMIECVPNFSEGRDLEKVRAIVDAITGVPGVLLLGWEADPDHHRAVVTFAGDPPVVREG